MKICFASRNKNKLSEIASLLPDHLELVGLDDLGITEDITETGKTFGENARIKARYVHKKCNLPVFADDSGLLVDALNEAPGVLSARYAGEACNDEHNIDLLLKNMIGRDNRKAHFKTVVTLIDRDGKEYQFHGAIHGHILKARKGSHGFGYDPIFVPAGYTKSFAEFPKEEKNKISHRAKAIQKLLIHLRRLHG